MKSLQPPTSADNVALHAFPCCSVVAAECRPPQVQTSIDICRPPGPQQQIRSTDTRRSDGTDGRTDARRMHRSAYTVRAVSISVASQQRFISAGPPYSRTRIYVACVSRPDPRPAQENGQLWWDILSAYKTNDRKRSVVIMYQTTGKAANLYSQDLMLI